jgi:ABC-type lipoprotein release transport system permease subunit
MLNKIALYITGLFLERTWNYLDIMILFYVFDVEKFGMRDWQTYVYIIGGMCISSFIAGMYNAWKDAS